MGASTTTRTPQRRHARRLVAALCLGATIPSSLLAAAEVAAVARLTAPAAAVIPIQAKATLLVRSLPADPGMPVAAGRILVEQDTAILEGRLAKRQQELTGMQAENRQKAVGARQGTGEIGQPEVQAAREILDLQAEITAATTVAPQDGYVVRHHFAVGARAKRRKPLLDFVPATATVVELTLARALATDYPAGARVRVAAASDRAAAFDGTILTATAAEASVVLRIRPAALPFLALDAPTDVALSLSH